MFKESCLPLERVGTRGFLVERNLLTLHCIYLLESFESSCNYICSGAELRVFTPCIGGGGDISQRIEGCMICPYMCLFVSFGLGAACAGFVLTSLWRASTKFCKRTHSKKKAASLRIILSVQAEVFAGQFSETWSFHDSLGWPRLTPAQERPTRARARIRFLNDRRFFLFSKLTNIFFGASVNRYQIPFWPSAPQTRAAHG